MKCEEGVERLETGPGRLSAGARVVVFAAATLVAVALSGCKSLPPDLSTPSIVVFDQAASMGTVVIQQVVSPGPGWIVISSESGDREATSVLGRAPVAAGLNRWIRVPLVAGYDMGVDVRLYATLHRDAGTAGKWEFPGPDVPVSTAKGPLTVSFLLWEGRRMGGLSHMP